MTEPRRRLAPVALAFVLLGVFWGGFAVAAADIEAFLGAGHGGFGIFLTVALVAGVVANGLGAVLAERWGTSRSLSRAMAAWGICVLGLAAVPWAPAFAVLFVLMVGASGTNDVVMNVAATAVLGDRPGALVRFHALFNCGALMGAAAMGLALHLGASWRAVWAGVGLAILLAAPVIGLRPLPGGAREPRVPLLEAFRVLRREHVVLLAAAFAATSMVEGGIDTWGVLFLRDQLALGALAGAGSYVAGQALAVTARVVLGPASGALGGTRGAAAGAALAAIGLVVEATASAQAVAAIGLALAAVGISLCWPLLLAAASQGTDRPGLVVGGVTAVGYLGFLVGPSVVGALAGVAGLRAGLLGLAAVSVAGSVMITTGRRSRSARADQPVR